MMFYGANFLHSFVRTKCLNLFRATHTWTGNCIVLQKPLAACKAAIHSRPGLSFIPRIAALAVIAGIAAIAANSGFCRTMQFPVHPSSN